MMTNRYWEVESAVLNAVKTTLQQFSSGLKEAKLTCRPPEIEVLVPDARRYTSELRLYFYRDEDLVDALEFHIFANGRQNVEPAEVSDWLSQDLADVISSNR
jgi:hypothetical protein